MRFSLRVEFICLSGALRGSYRWVCVVFLCLSGALRGLGRGPLLALRLHPQVPATSKSGGRPPGGLDPKTGTRPNNKKKCGLSDFDFAKKSVIRVAKTTYISHPPICSQVSFGLLPPVCSMCCGARGDIKRSRSVPVVRVRESASSYGRRSRSTDELDTTQYTGV